MNYNKKTANQTLVRNMLAFFKETSIIRYVNKTNVQFIREMRVSVSDDRKAALDNALKKIEKILAKAPL